MANEAMLDRAYAIGCCSVTGRIGDHLAIILYSPTDGMRSLDMILREQQHLWEAMDALLEISRRLKTESAREIGLQKGDPFSHPMPLPPTHNRVYFAHRGTTGHSRYATV